MCEYLYLLLRKNNKLTKVMENVIDVNPTNWKVYLTDLLGEEKILDGYIKEIKLIDHKIILAQD